MKKLLLAAIIAGALQLANSSESSAAKRTLVVKNNSNKDVLMAVGFTEYIRKSQKKSVFTTTAPNSIKRVKAGNELSMPYVYTDTMEYMFIDDALSNLTLITYDSQSHVVEIPRGATQAIISNDGICFVFGSKAQQESAAAPAAQASTPPAGGPAFE